MSNETRLIIGPPTVMWKDRDGTIHTETIMSRDRMHEWTAEREAEEPQEVPDLTAPFPATPVADEWLDGSDWFGAYLCDACGAISRREEIIYDRECPHCGITLSSGVLAYQIGSERYEVSVGDFMRAQAESFGQVFNEEGVITP